MSMLSDNFTVTGVDARQWLNLLSTLPLQGLKGRTLYILHQGGEILQAFHPERGRIPTPTLPITNPAEDAAKLLEEYGGLEETEAVVMVEQGLPHRLLAKIRETYNPEGDILSFLGAIRQAIQGEFGHGLTVAPAQAWKAGLLEVLGRAERLISIIPDDAVSLLAVFEGERVWTSLLAVKRDGRLHQISTTQALEPPPLVFPDWREDYPKLLERAGRRFGRVALGLFTDVEVFRFLMRSENPVAYLRQARRAGQIILDPLPRRIASLL